MIGSIGAAAAAICIIICTAALQVESGGAEVKFKYEIKEFQVPLDHFSFLSNATFNIRYLYNDSFVDKKNAHTPIFFYTGNEGDIELFAQNTGFMWELAEKQRALLIFAEHRYYGKSLPFGASTFNASMPDHLAYFTVEQTLEDYAMLITFLRNDLPLPVVAFGGSYGGMLAAWFRMKYPHLVAGALAASAPILQFPGITDCDIFYRIVTSVFQNAYNSNCTTNIGRSWKTFETLGGTEAGKKQISDAFHLCNPIKNDADLKKFLDYIEEVYGNLAMVNYPYNSSFLAPLPAYPVRQVCFYLKDLHQNDADLLHAMASALAVYTNYTNSAKCLDISVNSNADESGWNVQTCNQMVMPFCSNGTDTMFRPSNWNFKEFSDKCYKDYRLTPKPYDIILRYGGRNIETATNIIFSNGLLDPWSGGGVLQAPNNKVDIIILPEGAHHLDLRHSDPADPPSVRDARNKEAAIIARWIQEF
ncbi:lysosomal Pro-X carboxypeptidase [Drosophila guanche]|uniref:Lysosomal Pro-X carboxypeptidase n=1 Tax=Drosophila guanche TaxID=7266 RepID=A0A3B0JPE7_DROGU|nr:lysosomal Pro-X carboxypeptidase [Drosophila guanche]SPP82232.1 blast:Lysosomal Pro-X carboxypeptidase [Drosophila guanche]